MDDPLLTINRVRYLHLLESVLTGTLTRDPPADPWSRREYDKAKRDLGQDWPATALTMIGTARMRQLRHACEDVLKQGIPGDFIETGVWRGGACIYMRAILEAWGATDRTVWAADSFRGLPPPRLTQDAGDQHHTFEQLAVSLAEVDENFTRFGFPDIKVLVGWFADTLPAAPIERLAILRLDGDMYESTGTALNALYPRLSSGGFCIVDDYNLAPCRSAVLDYWQANKIEAEMHDIEGMGVYWRKGG